MYQLITAIILAFESGVDVERATCALRYVMDAARDTNTPLPIDLLLGAVLYECDEARVRASFGTDVSLLVSGFTRDPAMLTTRTLGVVIIVLADAKACADRGTVSDASLAAITHAAKGVFARYESIPALRGVQLADKLLTVGHRLLRAVAGD